MALRSLSTRANGQPAVAAYRLTPEGDRFVPIALDVLTLDGASISEVTAFRTPDLFRWFGLPTELPS
jgi:RNA polymerase sigma-70 factor (ECF subfamily)